jgi:3-oxoacyl-[acyl-carrier-protein] synthase-3
VRFNDDIYLAGVASWLPPREPIGQGRYEPGEQDEHDWESASVAGDDETVVGMAVRAGRLALERSGVDPAEVSLLLHAHTWFQGLDVWTAAAYIHHALLGENRSAAAIDLNQQCPGGVSALQLGADHLIADPGRRAVVVTTADRFSLPGLDRWHAEGPEFILGDGAAAMVLARGHGFARLLAARSVADTTLEPMSRGDNPFTLYSTAYPAPIDAHARTKAFLQKGIMGVDEVIARLNRGHADAVHGLLDEAGLTVGDVSRFVFPNVGLRQLIELVEPLGIEVSQTTWELGRTTGHVGAADPINGLTYLLEHGQLRAGDRVMMVGIGAGFFWSGALVQCVEVPDWPPAAGPELL